MPGSHSTAGPAPAHTGISHSRQPAPSLTPEQHPSHLASHGFVDSSVLQSSSRLVSSLPHDQQSKVTPLLLLAPSGVTGCWHVPSAVHRQVPSIFHSPASHPPAHFGSHVISKWHFVLFRLLCRLESSPPYSHTCPSNTLLPTSPLWQLCDPYLLYQAYYVISSECHGCCCC